MSARKATEVVFPIPGDALRRITRLIEPNRAARIVHKYTSTPKRRTLESWRLQQQSLASRGEVSVHALSVEYGSWVDEQDVYWKVNRANPLVRLPSSHNVPEVSAFLDVNFESNCELGVLLNGLEHAGGRSWLDIKSAERLRDEITIVIELCKQHRYRVSSGEYVPVAGKSGEAK